MHTNKTKKHLKNLDFEYLKIHNSSENAYKEQQINKTMQLNFDHKKYDDVIKDIDLLLNENPDKTYLWKNKALCHYLMGDLSRAIQCCDESIKITNNNPEMIYLRGVYLCVLGNYGESIKAFESAIALGLQDTKIMYNYAIAHFKKGDYKKASEILSTIGDRSINITKILIMEGLCCMRLGSIDAAIGKFDEILEIDKNNKKAWEYKSECYLSLVLIEKVSECYDALMKIDPQNHSIYFRQGIIKTQDHLYEEALAFFDKAISIDSHDKNCWHHKAKCYVNLKNYKEAIEIYKHIISSISPTDLQAWCMLASCYNESQQYDLVKETCDHILKNLDPYNSDVLMIKFNYHIHENNVNEAIECIENAIDGSAGRNVDLLKLKAICHTIICEYKKAIECYEEVLKKSPGDTEAIIAQADVYVYLHSHSDVLSCYDRVLAIQPDNIDVLLKKGNYCLKLDDYEGVILCYKAYLEICNGDFSIMLTCAKCYLQIEKYSEAKKMYDKILENCDDNMRTFVLADKMLCNIMAQDHKKASEILDLISDVNNTKEAIEYINYNLIYVKEVLRANLLHYKDSIIMYLNDTITDVKGVLSLIDVLDLDCEQIQDVISKVNILDEFKSGLLKPSSLALYAKYISYGSGEFVLNELCKVSMLFASDFKDCKLSLKDVNNLKIAFENFKSQNEDLIKDPIYSGVFGNIAKVIIDGDFALSHSEKSNETLGDNTQNDQNT